MDTKPYQVALSTLFKDAEFITYPRNQLIVTAYEPVEHMFRIYDGFVKVYAISARGDELVHVVYGPGDIFPITLLLDESSSQLFYQSITDCKIARKPMTDICSSLEGDAALTSSVLKQIVEQYKVYVSRVHSLEFRYARERLAHRLLTLASHFGVRDGNTVVLHAPLTQQVVASSINLSRETVSREMERFVAKGYLQAVSRSGAPWVITDLEGLAQEIPGSAPYISYLKDGVI